MIKSNEYMTEMDEEMTKVGRGVTEFGGHMTEPSGCMTAAHRWPTMRVREEGSVSGDDKAPAHPRRAPEPDQRKRDAERSRERILAAAAEEFGAHGFAGARVAHIAARAGVNQQLISYYFGGKQGLYDALGERWLAKEAVIADPALPVDKVIAGYFNTTATEPMHARLLLWQALGDAPSGTIEQQEADTRPVVEDLRRRQRNGELTSEYDADFTLLVLGAAAMAPVALPQAIQGAYGANPDSEEFRDRFLPQLQRLFRPRD